MKKTCLVVLLFLAFAGNANAGWRIPGDGTVSGRAATLPRPVLHVARPDNACGGNGSFAGGPRILTWTWPDTETRFQIYRAGYLVPATSYQLTYTPNPGTNSYLVTVVTSSYQTVYPKYWISASRGKWATTSDTVACA
jgi:hypothetical protein